MGSRDQTARRKKKQRPAFQNFNIYDFARRSDGFKRFITFLLMVSAKARTDELVNTLYLHDEPDTSLHPSGARYLRDELIKIAKTNYVVYSSHSIFMIDRELLNRHLIVKKHNEVTTVSEVNDSNFTDEEVIYNALGYSIFENLKKHNIIFEGWRDKRLCQVALKTVPAKHKQLKTLFSNIGFCYARGVKDVARITPMLELARRSWVVVSDGDRPAKEQQRLYKGEGPWLRYDELLPSATAITGEDFVKVEAFEPAVRALRQEYPQLPEVAPGDFATRPRLSVIRNWLENPGIRADGQKAALETFKERLFDNLKPSHVEDDYYDLLAALAQRFPLQD